MATKYYLGALLLVLLTSSIYVVLNDSVRIDVGNTYSTFKVYEEGWVLAGQEYTILYDGTKKMRASSRNVESFIDGNITTIIRTANFKDNITAIDTYTFDGSSEDITLFPISHEINILNGEGKILVYEVTKLEYILNTFKDISSPQRFGHNMKIEWEDGNYYSRIYKYSNRDEGKLTIKYRPDSDNFTKNVRLFDPPSDWTASPFYYDGDTVYINDSKAYIKSTSISNQPTIEFMSKQFTGDVNIVFGFNTEKMRPTKAEHNPYLVNISKSYTCNYEFNYTTNPNYFWCYEEIVQENGTSTRMIFEHSFETGDVLSKTASWTEQITKWDDLGGVGSIYYDFQGMNKWYYKNNYPIVAGDLNTLKLTIDYFEQIQSINEPGHKYWIAFYPSSETIQQAIANDHFYALDPWTVELNANLSAYFPLNETSGSILDSVGGFDGTNDGCTANTPGIIGTSYLCDNPGTERMTWSSSPAIPSNWSISAWLNRTDAANDNFATVIDVGNFAADNGFGIWINIAGNVDWRINQDIDHYTTNGTVNLGLNNWTNIVMVYDGSRVCIYKNGVVAKCNTFSTDPTLVTNYMQFAKRTSAGGYNGIIDEVGIWNRSLSPSEITQLYNNGTGITWTDIFPPESNTSVILNSPVDNFNSTIQLVIFNCTSFDGAFNITNTSLILNDVFNETNSTSGLNNSDYIFTKTLVSGDYTWTCEACNTENDCFNATTRTFSVNLNITGTIKEGVTLLANASVFVVNQSDNSFVGNVTSNGTGFWTIGSVLPGTYIITGYDPTNTTLDGDAEPHVVVP